MQNEERVFRSTITKKRMRDLHRGDDVSLMFSDSSPYTSRSSTGHITSHPPPENHSDDDHGTASTSNMSKSPKSGYGSMVSSSLDSSQSSALSDAEETEQLSLCQRIFQSRAVRSLRYRFTNIIDLIAEHLFCFFVLFCLSCFFS